MHLWVHMEDASSLVLLIPNNHPYKPQLIGFHLSLTMGYINSSAYLFTMTETATEMVNAAIER